MWLSELEKIEREPQPCAKIPNRTSTMSHYCTSTLLHDKRTESSERCGVTAGSIFDNAHAPIFCVIISTAKILKPDSILAMEGDMSRPLPVPKPRPFPITGVAPGPRCGQTLTAIAGPDGDLSKARLVLFGGRYMTTPCNP